MLLHDFLNFKRFSVSWGQQNKRSFDKLIITFAITRKQFVNLRAGTFRFRLCLSHLRQQISFYHHANLWLDHCQNCFKTELITTYSIQLKITGINCMPYKTVLFFWCFGCWILDENSSFNISSVWGKYEMNVMDNWSCSWNKYAYQWIFNKKYWLRVPIHVKSH